ncbi:hypothetical protein [Microbulbifer epialgicus]|uniref:Uncharacterized protein n=1 Tax=Microbulbifer epialgicus TaxID=393907 RepID=A0ABV4P542_9GAMM
MSIPAKDIALTICAALLCVVLLTTQSKAPKMMYKLTANMQSLTDVITTSSMVKGVVTKTNQLKIQHQPISEWRTHIDADEI